MKIWSDSNGIIINMGYITKNELVSFTGISYDDESELLSFITQAEEEFEFTTGRTISESESIYSICQRAISFLTSYFIRRKRGEFELSSMDKEEYTRLMKIVMRNIDVTSEDEIIFQPQFTSVDIEE